MMQVVLVKIFLPKLIVGNGRFTFHEELKILDWEKIDTSCIWKIKFKKSIDKTDITAQIRKNLRKAMIHSGIRHLRYEIHLTDNDIVYAEF